MIASFGEAIFEVSDRRIHTFTGFTRNVSIRKETHNIIGQKPKTEVIGPELDSISFTITLNKNLGIDVRQEMDRWVSLVRSGEANMLIVGDKALGVDMWIAESVGESWDVISVNGTILSGKINVTLQEYVR